MCKPGGFEGHDRVDWARPANKIPFEPTPYSSVPHSLQEPVYGDRWDQFEKNKHQYIRELPPPGAPVRFKWDENDDSQFEMFLATMYRDGWCVSFRSRLRAFSLDLIEQCRSRHHTQSDCCCH